MTTEHPFDTAQDHLTDAFDADDITMAHLRAYVALLDRGPLTRQDVATEIARSLRTVDGVLADFRERGLVETEPDPYDRRRTLYGVSAE